MCWGIVIALDANTMNCTFFGRLSAAGTDTVFIPVCDATHMSEQYLNMQQLQVTPIV